MAAINPMTGGAGGRADEDGQDGSGANQGFLKNTPVEINEAEAGIKVLRYGLAPDSAGPGLHRGGLATEMTFQAFAPNTRVTARNRDRTRFTGWGIAGGRAGGAIAVHQEPRHQPGGRPRQYGHPHHRPRRRDPCRLRRRRRLGRPARARAGRRAARLAPGLGHDRSRPRRLRGGDRGRDGWTRTRHAPFAARARTEGTGGTEGNGGFYDVGAERRDFETVWTEENYAALTECLARLPVHWRFYAKHRIFAAIELTAPGERHGDGSEVRRAFEALCAELPQLSAKAA